MTDDMEFLFTPCAFTTDKEVEKLQNDYDNNEGDKADAALGRLNAIGNVLNDQRAPIRDLLNDQFIQVIDEIWVVPTNYIIKPRHCHDSVCV